MGKYVNVKRTCKKEEVMSGANEFYAAPFNPYLFYVELDSTKHSVSSGPLSNSNRHVILQCCMLVFPKLLPHNGCF